MIMTVLLKGIIYTAFKHAQAISIKRLYLFLVERCYAADLVSLKL